MYAWIVLNGWETRLGACGCRPADMGARPQSPPFPGSPSCFRGVQSPPPEGRLPDWNPRILESFSFRVQGVMHTSHRLTAVVITAIVHAYNSLDAVHVENGSTKAGQYVREDSEVSGRHLGSRRGIPGPSFPTQLPGAGTLFCEGMRREDRTSCREPEGRNEAAAGSG